MSTTSSLHTQVHETPSSEYDVVKATQYGKYERCQELLDQGFDVNQRDDENITLLHWAAINARKEISKLYLDRGAIVDAVGGELSSTPLHWATRQGHISIVILLMKHGADPSLRDGEGCSAIHLAAQFGYTTIVAYLLAKGISPDIQDKNGLTPLMWAAARIHGYDPARLLITFGANTSIQDKIRQNTVFHWAIQSKNSTAVQLLSKKNVSLYIPNEEGDTAYTLLQKIKTNDWIDKRTISKIIERSDAQNTGRGFLNIYRRDKNFRFWGTACIPFIVIYLIGLTFSADISLMLKALVFVIGFAGFRAFGQLVCDDRFMNIFPLSVYLSTKMWMYLVWFYYMSPIVPFSTTFLMVSISSLLWYNFLRAWLGDPGRINVSIYERHQTIIDLAEEDGFDPKSFCTTCLIRKPIRSKHCSTCDKCVARFDHHCPWLSNCIGWKNHKYFIGYLFTLVVTCLMYIYGAVQFWSLNCGLEETPWAIVSATVCNPWVSFMTSQAVIHAFWVFILLICQLYQVLWLGITTNERVNYHRYTYFKNGGRRNGQLINNGVFYNMIDFFELNCFRRENVDWMRAYPIPPPPDDLGEEDNSPLLVRNRRDNFQYV